MYVIELTYLRPLAEIERQLEAHRAFLDTQYARGYFLASGPKSPRDGGVILASGRLSRPELDGVLAADPFQQHGLAGYRVTEFAASKHHPALAALV